MKEDMILARIVNACDDENLDDLVITFSRSEIVFLAKYIERLEEKELILNRLLGRENSTIVNVFNNK